MGLNPEVLPVWGTNTTYVRTKLVPSENSLFVLPSHKKQSSHSNKAECFLFSLLQGYPKRQREFNVLKCLSFPLPAFAFFQNFWETSAVIWQSLFFPRPWWYSQSCAERPLHLIAYYQFSLCYLPNHHVVLPSWHLLKYFTKHPEDNNPHCDKRLAGWRALFFFHTTPTNFWHNPLVADSCPTVIHSPLPLIHAFPNIVSKPPETPMHATFISYLSMEYTYFLVMRLRQKNRQ